MGDKDRDNGKRADVRPEGLPDEVALYSAEKLKKACGGRRPREVVEETLEALAHPKNTAWQLKVLRKNARVLCDVCVVLSETLDDAVRESHRLRGELSARHRKRWTKAEDEALVEMASQEGATAAGLAAIFGRSPQAIATRLSELVGIERTKQTVLGRFVGTIGGAHVEGQAEGTVYLTKRDKGGADGEDGAR